MLPMILALKAIELRTRSPHTVTVTVQAQPSVLHSEETADSPTAKRNSVRDAQHADVNADVEMRNLPASIQHNTLRGSSPTPSDAQDESLYVSGSERSSLRFSRSNSHHQDGPQSLMEMHGAEDSERTVATASSADTLDMHHGSVRRLKSNAVVQPLPEFLEAYRREIVVFMIASFAVIILTTIMEDAITGILMPE
eukprot:gene42161-51485_t